MSISLLGFNGERLDPLSGATHLGNGYRAYYPALRRFNCPDSWSPFGHGGINPYAYCAGDPINRTDPSGHFSWQAGLGIGMGLLGILGILGAVFTAGASLVAAGSLGAALAASSVTALTVGTAGVVADVTGVVSLLTAQHNPEASALLGWLSLASGLLSLGAGLAAGGYRLLNKTVQQSSYTALAAEPILSSELPSAASLTSFEELTHNGLIMRNIMQHLSGLDVDSLRATSKSMLNNVHRAVDNIENYTIKIKRWENEHLVSIGLLESLKENPMHITALETVREIWRGHYPYTPPSQLNLNSINPASAGFMAINHSSESSSTMMRYSATRWDRKFIKQVNIRNRIFRAWQSLFHSIHPEIFIED